MAKETRSRVIRVADATWVELRDAVAAGWRTALVPLGATEQHGPHMGCGADTVRAGALAERVADAWGVPLLLAPAIPVGVSDEHGGFPGLVGVGAETYAALLVDLATRLSWWGVTRVVFLNAHGGNADALAAARRALADAVPWLRVDAPALRAPDDDPAAPSAAVRGLHAGEAETSEVLALRPSLVRPDALAPGLIEEPGRVLAALRRRPVHEIAPSGVLGDPRGATAARGARRLEALAAAVVAVLEGGDGGRAG